MDIAVEETNENAMSQIGVLLDQYKRLVTTSDNINNSIVVLKKRSLLKEPDKSKYPNLRITQQEIEAASELLINFLENVSKVVRGDARESEFLPSLVFEDYKKKISTNQFLEEDLKELISKLKIGEDIESNSISVLDELLSVLDIERRALFRKLRAARG